MRAVAAVQGETGTTCKTCGGEGGEINRDGRCDGCAGRIVGHDEGYREAALDHLDAAVSRLVGPYVRLSGREVATAVEIVLREGAGALEGVAVERLRAGV